MQAGDEVVRTPGKGISGIDGVVSRLLNRPVSRQISSRAAALPVTADQWSYAAFAVVCAGAAAFFVRAPVAGALLTHLGSVLDGVDGEVARLQGTASARGALLDLTLDRVGDTALLAGMAAGAGGRNIDWLLALAAAGAIVTASAVKERASAEGVVAAELQQREAAGGDWLARLMPFGGRDGRLAAVTMGGLLRQPRLALLWLAVTANLRLLRRLTGALAALPAPPSPARSDGRPGGRVA